MAKNSPSSLGKDKSRASETSGEAARELLAFVISVVMTCVGLCAAQVDPSMWWASAIFAMSAFFTLPGFGARWYRRLFDVASAHHARRRQKRLDLLAAERAEVRANADGLIFPKEPTIGVVPWDAIVQVELEWTENPWGDPQFGTYSDFTWSIVTRTARRHSVADDAANRAALLPALSMHLPEFDFIYESFHATEPNGLTVCWSHRERSPVDEQS
ncbi:MAG: hypothetical protein QM784_17660 [Polyangiaceae bacterium]